MAQAIWKGHISFGLVSIPVALYSAERRADLHFRMLDSRNQARIRYERVNDETGEEVPWDKIVKGFEYHKGNYVVIEDKDFKNAAPEATQSIDIEQFVEIAGIGYRYFDKPYYLVPEGNAKGYVLLRNTLSASNKAGIAKVVIRNRQHLAAVVAKDNALLLNLLRFHQELRSEDEFKFPDKSSKEYRISKKEQDMAAQLIDAMSGDWEPDNYHDDYRQALLDYIEQKAKKGKTAAEPRAETKTGKTAEIIDFTERLRRSVEQSRGGDKASGRKKSAAKKKSASKRGKRSTAGKKSGKGKAAG